MDGRLLAAERRALLPLLVAGCVTGVTTSASTVHAATVHEIEWTRQLGTPQDEFGRGIAVDNLGNLFVTGRTSGSLGGASAGDADAFLAKYDTSGGLIWTRQLGTSSFDQGWSVVTDATGNAFITGETLGSLGGPHAGEDDAFVAKYDPDGTLMWTRQLGTSASDRAFGITGGTSGNIYITGRTFGSLGGSSAGSNDVFLASYDSDGNLRWTEQFGDSGTDRGWAIESDALENRFITGYPRGSLGGPNAGGLDMFIAKYDSDGNALWTRQLGTSETVETGLDLAVDSAGNVILTGASPGSLAQPNAGGNDVIVAKYDTDGNQLWVRQMGTTEDDGGFAVTADSTGGIYVAGRTLGTLGQASAGDYDAFVMKLDAAGTQVWTTQFGTANLDWGYAMAIDAADNLYLTGETSGPLGGPHVGGADVFVAKLSVPAAVPAPSAALAGLALLGGLRLWLRRRA